MVSLFSKKIEQHKWLRFLIKKIKTNLPQNELSENNQQSAWDIIKNKKQKLWLPLIWQTAVILADAGTIYCIFRGFDVQINIGIVIIGLMLTKIIAMLSVTPGSLVFFEGAMVLFYTSFSVPLQLAVVSTLLFRSLSFWLPMPFGLFMYRHLNKNLTEKSA